MSLPLSPLGDSTSSGGSSDEGMIVSIPRDSLTDPLYKKQRFPSPSDGLYVPPIYASPRPRRRTSFRRFSTSVSGNSKRKFGHRRKRKKQRIRRHSAPVGSRCLPTHTRPEHLMVSIPIYHGQDGDILCRGVETDDSDVPTTAMELLAASLDEAKEARRLPQIVHLESHFPGEDSEDVHCKAVAESSVEVAEYCSEVNVMSVCSAEDLTMCVRDLTCLCHQTNLLDGSGGPVGTPLDVGDEIELGEMSQDVQSSAEVTGMELLNLQRSISHSCTPSTCRKVCNPREILDQHYFIFSLQNLPPVPTTWEVHTLDRKGL